MKLTTISDRSASILGMGINRDMETGCLKQAFIAGINYFFFYEKSAIENSLDELKTILVEKRQDILIATGSESRSLKKLEKYLDAVCSLLNLDVVDVFFLEYVSPADDLTQIKTLLKKLRVWQQKGLIRYLGISTHNRAIALQFLEEKQIDVLMHRYNMAHRKAETEVFPAAIKVDIPAIAFTSTRWGALLKGHPDWQGKIPTAADCYRYALNDRAVTMAMTAPKTVSQLSENLQVLTNSQLTEPEKTAWRSYGDLIYGEGQDSFETQWL